MEQITDNGLYQTGKTEESLFVSEGEILSGNSPNMVVFPRQRIDLTPLKLEVEESVEDMSPRNMWQVYVFVGFMVTRWIWSRWKDRQEKSPKE